MKRTGLNEKQLLLDENANLVGKIPRRNRGATASQISRYLYAAIGTRISMVNVSKRFHGRKLLARRSAVCVPLTSMNGRVHLTWCRQRRDWIMD
ncbi:HTH_Tnp_Tc3_2 domain-containing protein [Trichonephila clavipes]|nr:HTH_Tnp_Tc3_2 domain-containing protein [Trichonephila clavipes]